MRKDLPETAIFTVYDEFEGHCPEIQPEKDLLLAILFSALNDYKQMHNLDAKKAKAYLLDPSEDYIFSFRSVCNHLNICPDKVLKKIDQHITQ